MHRMPHITLEYSANLVETVDQARLFDELHTALLELEAFPRSDIKSRVVRHATYYIDDGEARHAFVHLDFSLLAGRDISVRQRIVQICSRVLTQYFSRSLNDLNCQLSIEVREIERSTYIKHRQQQ